MLVDGVVVDGVLVDGVVVDGVVVMIEERSVVGLETLEGPGRAATDERLLGSADAPSTIML